MTMGPLQLSLAKPHCLDCVKPREDTKIAAIREIVEKMEAYDRMQEEG